MSNLSSYARALARLNEIRRRRGVNVKVLAKRFGVTPTTMSLWLNHGTSAERFFALAEALDCAVLVTPRRDEEHEAAAAKAVAAYIAGSDRPCCESSRILGEVRKLVAE